MKAAVGRLALSWVTCGALRRTWSLSTQSIRFPPARVASPAAALAAGLVLLIAGTFDHVG
jgi:hypothetical protein